MTKKKFMMISCSTSLQQAVVMLLDGKNFQEKKRKEQGAVTYLLVAETCAQSKFLFSSSADANENDH